MKSLQLVIKILIVALIYYMYYVNHLEIHTHTHTHMFIFQIIPKHVDYALNKVYITPHLHVAND
jgi:hypothetical protein